MTILFLWATPRTVSTAFERMMIERGDHLVLDEPWSRAYYFGPDRRSDRFPLVFPESTYAAVTAGVVAAGRDARVFVKDMASHAGPGLDDDLLATSVHTFLIRAPEAALTSLAREWPDFTEEEAGYVAQHELFDRVCHLQGTAPPVIESDRLRAEPDPIVQQWCDVVDIEHLPASLHWEPGPRPEWQVWRDWYRTAEASSGFTPPTTAATPTGSLTREVRAARPHYEALLGHSLGNG